MLLKRPYCRSSVLIVVLLLGFNCLGQDSLSLANLPLRKKIVIGGNTVAYAGTMTGLYKLWYSNYPLGKFHFFNDNQEWLQMDKVGHAYSCYNEGMAGIEMMKWAGYNQKQYSWIGGSYGFLIQTSVEVLDGFSEGWGASMGDVVANTVGSGLAISQSLLWDEQRIAMKYSYMHSPYAKYRPNVLGGNLPERMLKDYNGQTYWLSANLKDFAPDSKFPRWLNIAVGYGADGMVGGHDNTFESEGISYDYTDTYQRSRQFYLSPDIDLSKIRTKSKLLRTVLIMANALKVPMPTLEYHQNEGFKGHLLMF
ncbi:MAG: DUF2279 domain-containing protein [Bacteroidia bacterium]